MFHRSRGFSIVEMLIALAVIGVLTAIGYVLLPRNTMAVNQGERILGSAIQFARFEAIKRNTTLEVAFGTGVTELVIRDPTNPSVSIRVFDLDPQGGRVTVKSVSPSGAMAFNARGVATTQVSRDVTIGIIGTTDHDRALVVSGQGSVRRP